MMERKRKINNKWYYAPMTGGWGYELINEELAQTKEYWFPVICECPKVTPMNICSKHGTPD